MLNQQTLQGNWNEIKGKLRTKWGQLTNDELQTFDGNVDRLVGMIQRKTGEGRQSVEKYLEEVSANGASMLSHAGETVREFAHQAAEKVQESTKQATDSVRHGYEEAEKAVRHGYEEAEKVVRQRPAESVAVCFGAGVLVGLFLGMVMRSR